MKTEKEIVETALREFFAKQIECLPKLSVEEIHKIIEAGTAEASEPGIMGELNLKVLREAHLELQSRTEK